MSQEVVQVDAFTSEPYAGNPAAVCLLDGPADEGWMANVAREMNLLGSVTSTLRLSTKAPSISDVRFVE